jgi:hypothetical protein
MMSSLFTSCLTPLPSFFIWNRIFVYVFKNLETIIPKKNECIWVLGLGIKFNPHAQMRVRVCARVYSHTYTSVYVCALPTDRSLARLLSHHI